MKQYEILVIEDNYADIRLIEEILESTEHLIKIRSIMDGEEALSYLNDIIADDNIDVPNIIFLDLNLPVTSGFEILEQIKSHPSLKRIPTIIFTSSESHKDIKKSYDLHANAYVVKPFHLNVFLDRLKSTTNFWIEHVKLSE